MTVNVSIKWMVLNAYVKQDLLVSSVNIKLMNVQINHVKMVDHALISRMASCANVDQDLLVSNVKQKLTNVPTMRATQLELKNASIKTIHSSARVILASQDNFVKVTSMNVHLIHVLMAQRVLTK